MAKPKINLPPVNLLNFNRLRFWMADITMCEGGSCPVKDHCYRHIAQTSERQNFFIEPPYSMDGCPEFLAIESKEYEDRSRYRNNYGPEEDPRSSDQGH